MNKVKTKKTAASAAVSAVETELKRRVEEERSARLELVREYANKYVLENEVWEQLVDAPKYYISSFGRLAAMKKGSLTILDCDINANGMLYRVFKGKCNYIHLLVARYFNAVGLGDRVMHINRDNLDNKPDNLLKSSKGELTKRRPSGIRRTARRNVINEAILQFGVDGGFIRKWKNADEIQSVLNYRRGDVLMCAEGEVHTAYNYVWVFEKTEGEIFGRFPKLMEKLTVIRPLLITCISKTSVYKAATLSEASKISGIDTTEIVECLLNSGSNKEWLFKYNRKENE
ncbi:MAG: hypothetical protein ACI4J7_05265 [Ruminiclostridium sp.]